MVLGGLGVQRLGLSATPDALMIMGLFLLMVEGLLTYEFMLRNATLHVASILPSPAHSVRASYRRQGLLLGLVLFGSCALAGSSLRTDTPSSAYAAVHIALPLLIGIPIYAAVLCRLCRAFTEPEQAAAMGQKLSGGFFSADMALLIYGLAVAYGGLGAWLLVLHFAHRAWVESGNPTALLVSSGLGFVAATAALFWLDKKGISYLVRAAARIRYLDKQVLSMATPIQESDEGLCRGTGRPTAWMMVRLQISRRSPFWPFLIVAVTGALVVRADALGSRALMGAVALGLLLDVPGRWLQERLVTQDVLHWVEKTTANGASLRRPALIMQAVISVTLAVGLYAGGATLPWSALAGAICLFCGIVTGTYGARLMGSNWPPMRVALFSFGITTGLFWTQLPVV